MHINENILLTIIYYEENEYLEIIKSTKMKAKFFIAYDEVEDDYTKGRNG